MANDKTRTCGQIFVAKLGKKIWVHAKKGESCATARERVASKWGASSAEAPSPEAEIPLRT